MFARDGKSEDGRGTIWSRAGYVFLLWGGVIGFPVVAALADVIHTESTAMSVAYRAMTATYAIALMLLARRAYKLDGVGVMLVATYIFWFLYLARIAFETKTNAFG